MTTPTPTAAPPLRPWSRTWRYLVVVLGGVVAWIVITVELDAVMSADGTDPVQAGRLALAILVDLVLGVASVALLPLRRRFPVAIACATAGLTIASAAAFPAAALAAVSMGTRRRWRGVVVTGIVWVAVTLVYEGVYRAFLMPDEHSLPFALAGGGAATAVYAACIATGFYVGARRELLASLQERAETAEREQALKADAARQAERTRIAREMHDVLAHRISLVAMHAGALAYRTDLSREETAQAAGVIQDNAHRALAELREVLGVLRADGSAGAAEPPQPTLAELGALVAEVEETGTRVVLTNGTGSPPPPVTLSRTAFRVVQECLTNARKHAHGAHVDLRVAGGPGRGLTIRATNALTGAGVTAVPGGGMGLTGLRERAELAGGRLAYGQQPGGVFVVDVWLPWEEDA